MEWLRREQKSPFLSVEGEGYCDDVMHRFRKESRTMRVEWKRRVENIGAQAVSIIKGTQTFCGAILWLKNDELKRRGESSKKTVRSSV